MAFQTQCVDFLAFTCLTRLSRPRVNKLSNEKKPETVVHWYRYCRAPPPPPPPQPMTSFCLCRWFHWAKKAMAIENKQYIWDIHWLKPWFFVKSFGMVINNRSLYQGCVRWYIFNKIVPIAVGLVFNIHVVKQPWPKILKNKCPCFEPWRWSTHW